MSNKKWLISSFITILVFLTTLIIIDPLQIFHKSIINKKYLYDNMRLQSAGIINNFEFDSIILGSSMLENTSSIEASQVLGGEFINISISGACFYERDYLLSYSLKKKNIKRVVYSLDPTCYLSQAREHSELPSKDYSFLYDDYIINDIKVYFNSKFLNILLDYLKSFKIDNHRSLEYPRAWFEIDFLKETFGGLENWLSSKHEDTKKGLESIVGASSNIEKNQIGNFEKIEEDIIKAKKYIDEFIISQVSKNRDTEFIMFIPPYFRANFAIMKQQSVKSYQIHKAIVEYLVKESSKYDNLKIFGFEDNDFLDDIANYMDMIHYSQEINSLMLKKFKEKDGLLTLDNVDSYIFKSEEKAKNFDLLGLSKKIKEYNEANR